MAELRVSARVDRRFSDPAATATPWDLAEAALVALGRPARSEHSSYSGYVIKEDSMITIAPALVERPAVHYVALSRQVSMSQLGEVIPEAITEVAAWLAAQGIEPSGVPLTRYRVIDMDTLLQVEIGWPVDGSIEAPSRFVVDVMPAGTYGSATYRDLSEGVEGNAALIGWGNDTGVVWDRWDTADGDAFASRVEFFLTGPEDDPDPTTWLTEVVIKVAD